MEEEIWKPVKGFENKYQISSLGRFKNKTGKIVKPHLMYDGYYGHNLSDMPRRSQRKLHRMIAEAFIPNPDNLPCVHHKDHNKLNNSLDNLMWCTHQENMKLNYNNPNTKSGWVTKEMMQTPEWRKMLSDAVPKGKDHPKFEGYYLIGDRVFESSLAAEKALGIHHNIIQKRCKVTKPPGFDFIPVAPKS